MPFSTRINLLPANCARKELIVCGFAPPTRTQGGRTADLALQIAIHPLYHLSVMCGNLCNISKDSRAQKAQLAITPIAQSSRISQGISQLLYPELDALWPKLDAFSDLMDLKICEIEAILSPHFEDGIGSFNNSPHDLCCGVSKLQRQSDLINRAIQMLQIMLLALVKSCQFRILSIFHLQCASLCTAWPTFKELADQNLKSGLRAAVITHTSSAQSSAAAGLILFPSGAIGGISALLYMQKKIIDKLESSEFASERQLAFAALQSFYIARIGVALLALFELMQNLKRSTAKLSCSFVAMVYCQSCQFLMKIIDLIKAIRSNCFTKSDLQSESSDQRRQLKDRLQLSSSPQTPWVSPREHLESRAAFDTLGILETIISPLTSPEDKKEESERLGAGNSGLTPKKSGMLKRSRSIDSLFADQEFKRARRSPNSSEICFSKALENSNRNLADPHLLISAHWGEDSINSRMKP